MLKLDSADMEIDAFSYTQKPRQKKKQGIEIEIGQEVIVQFRTVKRKLSAILRNIGKI